MSRQLQVRLTTTVRVRVRVACINWSDPDAPHAVSYLYDDAKGIWAEDYHRTWDEAIERALRLRRLALRAVGNRRATPSTLAQPADHMDTP